MAQIIDIDEYNGKISLSIRSLEKNPQVHHIYRKKHFTDSRDKIGFKTLANYLPGWIEENEAYLKAKKNAQSEDFL
jgi:general stress protein 13